MLRGYVLRYLGLVASGASIAEARDSVPAPIRSFVWSRGQRLAAALGFETEHANDAAHVHRLAYLRLIAERMVDPNDVEGTRRLFEAKREAGAEQRAWVRVFAIVVALVAVCAASAGAWMIATRPGARDAVATSPPEEPSVEPEEPAHPLTSFFRDTLPDYVVALDAASSGRERPPPDDVASVHARVLEQLAREQPSLVPTMTALLDQAERYAVQGEEDGGHWMEDLVRFHDALAADDLPFYVDAELTRNLATGRQRVLLSTYRVLERRTFAAGDQRVRALDLARLDSLSFERSLLGYTRPEVRYALVLDDRVERFLVEDLLPSAHAAEESVIVRGYEDEVGIEWVTTFEQQAHEDLGAESAQAVESAIHDTRGLRALASAIVGRRNAIRAVNQSLRASGISFREPERYDYRVDSVADLGPRVDPRALASLRSTEHTLHARAVLDAYRALHAAIVLSIAQHETQHRLDYEADRLVAVPDVLSQYTGETESEDRVNRRAERANAELSAYLSQVAQQPALARTSLIHVASFLMNRHSWGIPETYAAIALFETLATEAGIEHGPLIVNRRIVRAEIARIYAALRERGPAVISELAARGWSRLYGAELPRIREVDQ